MVACTVCSSIARHRTLGLKPAAGMHVCGGAACHLWCCTQGLVLFSRLGVYIPLPGVDVAAFADSVKTEGLLGYIDTLSGGSISRVGIFSLGEVAVQPCMRLARLAETR